MAVYKFTSVRTDLALAADWTNLTTPESPETTVPGIADTAQFSATSGAAITGTATVAQAQFLAGPSTAWTFGPGQLSAGGFTIQTLLNVVSGGTLTLTGGTALVGNAAGNGTSLGTLNIGAGGVFNTTIAAQNQNYILAIGSTNSTGSVTVLGTGSLLDLNGNAAAVGNTGNGTLSVLAGGTARLGTPDPTNGGVAALAVGRGGTGSVAVNGGKLLLSGGFYAGRASGASGSVTVSNAGVLTQTSVVATDQNTIGAGGTINGVAAFGGSGSFSVLLGGVATLENTLVAGNQGDSGSVLVAGVGSRLNLGGQLFLGSGTTNPNGAGSLSVQDGGNVALTAAGDTSKYYVVVGNSASTSGILTVNGAGATLDSGANGVAIGYSGTGSATVSGGGTVRSSSADSAVNAALAIGRTAGAAGLLTVSGMGSSYTASGYVFVGRAGTGTLIVDQGGTFTGGQGAGGTALEYAVTIGDGTPTLGANGMPNSPLLFGGTGTARVSNGAMLHTLGNLDVGRRGTSGSVTVDTAGRVLVDAQLLVGSGVDRPGGTGTVTIQGGGTLKAGGLHVLATPGAVLGNDAGTSGTVTVTGAGSSLTTSGDWLSVGRAGTGTLSVLAGGTVTSGAAYADTESALNVGSLAGGVGTVTVSGAGSMLNAAGLAVLGGGNPGSGLAAGGTGTLSVMSGGLFRAANLSSFAGSSLTVDGTGTGVIGASAGTAGLLTVDQGATLGGAGTVHASVRVNGAVTATGGTLSVDSVSGTGTLGANGGTLVLGGLGGQTLQFSGLNSVIRVNALAGNGQVTGFAIGDALDFGAGLAASLAGSVITVRQGASVVGTETLAGLAPGVSVTLVADGAGGQKLVAGDPLFDPVYYLAHNPDIAAAGIDPYQHYVTLGWKEGRDPSALFSTGYYLAHNPITPGVNPLQDFENGGWQAGRDPSASFSTSDYLAANPDVKAAGIDPLLHYVQSGKAEGRAAFAVGTLTDPLVDAAYYYAHNPDVKAAGVDAATHYLSSGWMEGRNPDALFDTNFYLTQNPDIAAAHIDPLLHFEANGWREARDPSLLFSDAKYFAANPDVAAAGIDPLLHYVQSGQNEGRAAFLSGPSAAADPLVQAAYYDPQLGATLIPTGVAAQQQAAASYDAVGWQRGLNPDAYFNTAYYLSHNPDVAAAHIDPLLHYEANGWREGRDPSAQFSTSKYLAAYADIRAAGVDPLLHFVAFGQAEGRVAFAV